MVRVTYLLILATAWAVSSSDAQTALRDRVRGIVEAAEKEAIEVRLKDLEAQQKKLLAEQTALQQKVADETANDEDATRLQTVASELLIIPEQISLASSRVKALNFLLNPGASETSGSSRLRGVPEVPALADRVVDPLQQESDLEEESDLDAQLDPDEELLRRLCGTEAASAPRVPRAQVLGAR